VTNSVQAGLAVGIASDGGPSRERNEDFAGSYLAASGALIAVADGMGGHQAGDVASRLLVESLLARFAASSGRLQDRLLTALEQANLEVFQASRQAGHRGMGATLVVVALEGNVALIASAGDARAYLLRGGALTPLTRDHSWVAEQHRLGLLATQELRLHQWRHVVSNAAGGFPQLKIDLKGVLLRPFDRLILCSDGLTSVLEEAELAVADQAPPEQAARALLRSALERSPQDNVTVAVVALGGEPRPSLAITLPDWKGESPQPLRSWRRSTPPPSRSERAWSYATLLVLYAMLFALLLRGPDEEFSELAGIALLILLLLWRLLIRRRTRR
jgi:protein phosphatase